MKVHPLKGREPAVGDLVAAKNNLAEIFESLEVRNPGVGDPIALDVYIM